MGEWLSPLDVRYNGRDDTGEAIWLLLSDLGYASAQLPEGEIWVPKGFVTDFASVPRVPMAYLIAGNKGHGAAVIHDWLCRNGYELGIPRDVADKVFHEALMTKMPVDNETPVEKWRADLMYAAVRGYSRGLAEADQEVYGSEADTQYIF